MSGSLVDGLAMFGAIVLVAWILKAVSDIKKKLRKVYLWWKNDTILENGVILYGHVLRRHPNQSELKRTYNFSGHFLRLQKARATRNAGATIFVKSKVT